MRHSTSQATPARYAPTPIALVAFALLHGAAQAQTPAEPPLVLQTSRSLREDIPAAVRSEQPTFVGGDSVQGRPDLETVIEGHAELRRGDTVIHADRLEYYQPDDLAKARGNVRINRAGNIYEGPQLELKVEAFEGFFANPSYRLLRNDAYGTADRVDFIDDKRSVIRNATYTTCQRRPGPDWMPDWILRATSLRIDEEEGVGQASGAVLSFMGLPVLPVPGLSFPLSEQRRSGVLPPTLGIDSLSGVQLTLPYYWNIAPNRDATVYPTLMSKRGIDLGGEFRYLESGYNGRVRADFMPSDQLRHENRWAYLAQHNGTLGSLDGSPVGLSLNLNRVSDDNYWRDFTHASTTALTQRLLSNDGSLNWAKGDFSMRLAAQQWQTLQDPTAPIVPPYDRLPQLQARYLKNTLPGGLQASVETDFTRFHSSDPTLNQQPNGDRAYLLGQLSLPVRTPGWFVEPKVQLHLTEYRFDTPLLATGATSAERTVPTFSLDSGLVFERDAVYFGRAFRQTLEPRAFYTYTPFRDQSALPNYDTAPFDFSLATIWQGNSYVGNDRIADNDLLTVGATTRLLDPDTGAEAARFGIAQRLRFKDERVVLPGETPISERLSDLLFGASIAWTPKWGVDTTVQYNPKTGQSARSTLLARYSPSAYHLFTFGYRLQRGQSEQVDLGWQWPLNDLWGDYGTPQGPGKGEGEGRWYGVGRLNYSVRDRRIVDSVMGFEYDGGCWIGRVVLERVQNGTTTSNTRILFQIEFSGFGALGSGALQTLRDNIPRYQFLRQQTTQPSRFGNYD